MLAVKTKLLLDSIDVWLLQQKTLIVKRKRSIIPAVAQRQVLADALAQYLSQLGLERRQKDIDIDPIKRIQAERMAAETNGNGTADEGESQP